MMRKALLTVLENRLPGLLLIPRPIRSAEIRLKHEAIPETALDLSDTSVSCRNVGGRCHDYLVNTLPANLTNKNATNVSQGP
jgi:hypothetical protein